MGPRAYLGTAQRVPSQRVPAVTAVRRQRASLPTHILYAHTAHKPSYIPGAARSLLSFLCGISTSLATYTHTVPLCLPRPSCGLRPRRMLHRRMLHSSPIPRSARLTSLQARPERRRHTGRLLELDVASCRQPEEARRHRERDTDDLHVRLEKQKNSGLKARYSQV